MHSTINEKKSFKRRKVYINKTFQAKFIIKFIFVLIFGGILTIGLTWYNTQETLTSYYQDSRLVIENTSLAILPSVIYTTVITTIFVGLIVVLVTLLVSHKIAGPMYRFEKDIENMAKGDLKSRINIRKGDQFQELAVSLNVMIDELNNKVSAIKTDVLSLNSRLDIPKECHQDIIRINEKINSIFKL